MTCQFKDLRHPLSAYRFKLKPLSEVYKAISNLTPDYFSSHSHNYLFPT